MLPIYKTYVYQDLLVVLFDLSFICRRRVALFLCLSDSNTIFLPSLDIELKLISVFSISVFVDNLLLVATDNVNHGLKLPVILRVIENENPLLIKATLVRWRGAFQYEINIVRSQCNKIDKLGLVFKFESFFRISCFQKESKHQEKEQDHLRI